MGTACSIDDQYADDPNDEIHDLSNSLKRLTVNPDQGLSIIYCYTCKECGMMYIGYTCHPHARQLDHYRPTNKNSGMNRFT